MPVGAVMLALSLLAGGGPPGAGPESAPASDGNLLADASFERVDGEPSPWWSFHERSPGSWGEFAITNAQAAEGERSALLVLDSDGSDKDTRVWGVVQEVEAERCPEYLSGYYRVEGWERGTPKQYLQVVVIVWRPGSMPEGVNAGNYQLACTLAGVDRSPLPGVVNRKFVITGPVEPDEDEWVFFELPLAELFEREWGRRPADFEYLRVFFEARYDGRRGGERARARVFYDDLYMGDRSRAPAGDGATDEE